MKTKGQKGTFRKTKGYFVPLKNGIHAAFSLTEDMDGVCFLKIGLIKEGWE